VGLGSFAPAFRRSSFYLPRKSVESAHSDYLEWLVELGGPAYLLLTGSLLACLRTVRRTPLAAGCLLGVGAALLHATVDLPLQLPGLAALLAALLGLACSANPARARGGAVVLGLLAMGLAAVRVQTPEALYVAAGEASARGELGRAGELYRAALERNSRTAPAWLRLAEIERGRGDEGRALMFARAARWVEPFTLRTEWPLAELELEAGDAGAGAQRLAGLVAAAPDLLEAALHTASRSGVGAGELQRLVPPGDAEAAGRYLAFLVRNRAGDRVAEAYAGLGRPELPEPYREWLAQEAGFRP
jgi:hypothetical protein